MSRLAPRLRAAGRWAARRATSMLMAAIPLLGLIGYELLPVAALPNIDSPTILGTARLPGADAQTVAGIVTTLVERQFGQIHGLTQMTSSGVTEYVQITLQFDRTLDSAAQDVQAANNATAGLLPPTMLALNLLLVLQTVGVPLLPALAIAGQLLSWRQS